MHSTLACNFNRTQACDQAKRDEKNPDEIVMKADN